jgi:hypothetical protein
MNIEDLRKHLFATLEDLRSKDKPLELDRAKAISEIAQTIINSAKVEVDHLRVTGATAATDFIPEQKAPQQQRRIGAIK